MPPPATHFDRIWDEQAEAYATDKINGVKFGLCGLDGTPAASKSRPGTRGEAGAVGPDGKPSTAASTSRTQVMARFNNGAQAADQAFGIWTTGHLGRAR